MSDGVEKPVLEGTSQESAGLWKGTVVSSKGLVRDAIANLQKTGLQISLVVSSDGLLVGTVTDGDVRRGLLRGLEMDSPIGSIMREEPFVVPPELSQDAALQLMKTNAIGALPIVNDDKHVTGLHLLKKLLVPDHSSNLIVIMAGGKGSRLQPYTNNLPKALLPVGGKPMVEHIIERARAEGFSRVVLSVHYLAEMVQDYFGDGKQWGVEIDYLHEQSPMGTAGALAVLNPRPEAAVLVSNCDVLTDIRYSELLGFHYRHSATATMAVRLHEWEHPFGVVQIEGMDIVGFEEKPVSRSRINAGVYVLEPEALKLLKYGEACDMPTLFERVRGEGARTIGFPMHEPWLDVGRLEDLEQARVKHKDSLGGKGSIDNG